MASAVVGLYVSYYQDVSSGPAIVLTGASIFVAVALGLSNRYRHAQRTP